MTERDKVLDELAAWGYYRYRNSLVKKFGIDEYDIWRLHLAELRIPAEAQP